MPGSLRNELECEDFVQPKGMYIVQCFSNLISNREFNFIYMIHLAKDDKLKQKAKNLCTETETCNKKQSDTNIKKDCEYLSSYITEEKYQGDYARKKQRKVYFKYSL
ncbi:hypothetical protein WN55_03974 [Dufourea novaeangliae]|uniref:Uncharacterized protein n=1 Tax=Dufourea novaeangliae TaxID=178035 RepID=A0A154PL16_DUFNO|nr:hypothetical protein WN55_03974 [Dufourea novaeangliae]